MPTEAVVTMRLDQAIRHTRGAVAELYTVLSIVRDLKEPALIGAVEQLFGITADVLKYLEAKKARPRPTPAAGCDCCSAFEVAMPQDKHFQQCPQCGRVYRSKQETACPPA